MDKSNNKFPCLAIPSGPLKPILILTYVSLVISPIIFSFSMSDMGEMGIASLWTNVSIPPLAIAYHTTILILHRRHARRTNETQPQNKLVHPTATIASLVCAYLLAVAWLVPLGILIGFDVDVFEGGFNVRLGTSVVQVVLDGAEFGIVMAVAVLSTRMRHKAHKWVPIDEVNLSTTLKS